MGRGHTSTGWTAHGGHTSTRWTAHGVGARCTVRSGGGSKNQKVDDLGSGCVMSSHTVVLVAVVVMAVVVAAVVLLLLLLLSFLLHC